MDAPDRHDRPLLPTTALDALVEQAVEGGRVGVERLLLEILVAHGLAEAAGLWGRREGCEGWHPIRSFGGVTPGPSEACVRPHTSVFALGDDRRVVTLDTAFDPEGRGEEREETIEALVALSAALLGAAGDDRDAPPGPLRRSA
ncbi:MAG: hypothetical protein AAGA20_05245 [Planctomycetota bacterium]